MTGFSALAYRELHYRMYTLKFPTNIVDFRGFDSSIILILKGWNSQAHRGFPGKLESSNVSRDNVSREIGRIYCY